MCTQWMFSCGETLTNGQNRLEDLRRLYENGCRECSDWAMNEMADDKKEPQMTEPQEL